MDPQHLMRIFKEAISVFWLWCCFQPKSVVQEHWELWKRSGVTDYCYVVTEFRPFTSCPSLLVEVRAGRPVSVTDQSHGQRVPCGRVEDMLTFDALFEKLLRAPTESPARLYVEYDEKLGHPIWVVVDPDIWTTDDEWSVGIDEFSRLP